MRVNECCTAWAVLYDALSLGFAYPDPEIYRCLQNGGYIRLLEENISRLPHSEALRATVDVLAAGVSEITPSRSQTDLETEYLALFELNPDRPPCHLYAHLHREDAGDPPALYQRLRQMFAAYGVDLTQREGVEQPDHLTVELEFLAYLYQRLSTSGATQSAVERNHWIGGIREFLPELEWIGRAAAQLRETGPHAFYGPLLDLADGLVAHSEAHLP